MSKRIQLFLVYGYDTGQLLCTKGVFHCAENRDLKIILISRGHFRKKTGLGCVDFLQWNRHIEIAVFVPCRCRFNRDFLHSGAPVLDGSLHLPTFHYAENRD